MKRNVRVISRNIEGGHRTKGILQEESLEKAVSVDWDNKVYLIGQWQSVCVGLPISALCQYRKIRPGCQKVMLVLFDNFNVDSFCKAERELYCSSDKKMVRLNDSYNDFGLPIKAVYQTPFLQFDAVEYLKTVRELYVQVRADTISVINITYFTEETPRGEVEQEPIIIYGRLWDNFRWDTFGYTIINFANVFKKKMLFEKDTDGKCFI